MNQINPIGPIKEAQPFSPAQKTHPAGIGQTSFKETLEHFVNDVNQMQN
jgi:hypothetical protein